VVKPYWSDEEHMLTLYHADCRDMLGPGCLTQAQTCYADPVWPNALPEMAGAENPEALFGEVCEFLPKSVLRLMVHLGADSDPRFLAAVPRDRFPFFRAATLDYARPHYKGRILYSFDVGYMFGPPPASRPGYHVVPGRVWHTDASRSKHRDSHPCSRRLSHVRWLLDRFSEPQDMILDPFAGAGTTLLAAMLTGRGAIGIEIDEKFCQQAATRLEQVIQIGGLFGDERMVPLLRRAAGEE